MRWGFLLPLDFAPFSLAWYVRLSVCRLPLIHSNILLSTNTNSTWFFAFIFLLKKISSIFIYLCTGKYYHSWSFSSWNWPWFLTPILISTFYFSPRGITLGKNWRYLFAMFSTLLDVLIQYPVSCINLLTVAGQ